MCRTTAFRVASWRLAWVVSLVSAREQTLPAKEANLKRVCHSFQEQSTIAADLQQANYDASGYNPLQNVSNPKYASHAVAER